MHSDSSQPRFVLVETSHPGNIGAAARAMKTMGFHQLWLVAPRYFPHVDASARAAGADDILEAAVVCDSLAEALSGCQIVYGASARERSIGWPTLEPRACAEEIATQPDQASALVFGRERSGLSNEELDLCQRMLHIPCNPDYRSLNLAAAVQVVACELHLALRQPPHAQVATEPLASSEEMEGFYQHLERVLIDLEFLNPDNPRQLPRKLRKLYNRARPDRIEVNILRGMLTAFERKMRH